MTTKNIKNMAASVRARLLDKSKAEGQAFSQMLQRYAMERFLYRLSVSEYADAFYLKGALLFWVWNLSGRRLRRRSRHLPRQTRYRGHRHAG